MSTNHDWLDKILISLMVLILPVGIWYSATQQEGDNSADVAAVSAQNEAKLQKVIEELKANKGPTPPPTTVPIEIETVSYSTESGELKIDGTAPGKNWNVMVSAIITKPAKPATPKKRSAKLASGSAQATDSAEPEETFVLGDAVEVKAVKTDSEGKFSYTYEIDPKNISLLDLRFDQGPSTAAVQYNFLQNKRTL